MYNTPPPPPTFPARRRGGTHSFGIIIAYSIVKLNNTLGTAGPVAYIIYIGRGTRNVLIIIELVPPPPPPPYLHGRDVYTRGFVFLVVFSRARSGPGKILSRARIFDIIMFQITRGLGSTANRPNVRSITYCSRRFQRVYDDVE